MALGSAVLSAEPAAAANGDNVILGQTNSAGATTEVDTTGGDGLHGTTTADGFSGVAGIDNSLDSGYGVYGESSNGIGVWGGGNGGVDSYGVYGVSNSGIGVFGSSDTGQAIQGESTTRPGVTGSSFKGTGVEALSGSGPQLRLWPGGLTAPPAAASVGQFIVLEDGSLWYPNATNTWIPVNSTVTIEPVRVINTTTGEGGITGPLVPGSTVYTSNGLPGTNGIPAEATAIVGNFAISGVGGALLNGYGVATIFPAGGSVPATANINAGAGCYAISNSVTVGLGTGTGAGELSIIRNGGGPVPEAMPSWT